MPLDRFHPVDEALHLLDHEIQGCIDSLVPEIGRVVMWEPDMAFAASWVICWAHWGLLSPSRNRDGQATLEASVDRSTPRRARPSRGRVADRTARMSYLGGAFLRSSTSSRVSPTSP